MIMMVIAVATFIAHSIWPSADVFCTSTPNADCLREWVGALSGWAATIAAGVTIIFLYRQNEEQRRQTEFMLGDASPTVDALQHLHRSAHVVIRIVNWNRRPIIVKSLRVDGTGVDYILVSTVLYDREQKTGTKERMLVAGDVDPPVAMHGWKDRSHAPCELRMDIAAPMAAHRPGGRWTGATVTVGLLIAGEKESFQSLTCPIAIAE